MPATRATSDVQTQAMPAMTLPATVCAAVVPVMKEHCRPCTQAASDMMTGTAISAATVPRPKPRALIVPGVADELRG